MSFKQKEENGPKQNSGFVIRLISKVTVFTLSFGLLSPPIPSFSGISKVKTFY
jgi:hypothetical protein